MRKEAQPNNRGGRACTDGSTVGSGLPRPQPPLCSGMSAWVGEIGAAPLPHHVRRRQPEGSARAEGAQPIQSRRKGLHRRQYRRIGLRDRSRS